MSYSCAELLPVSLPLMAGIHRSLLVLEYSVVGAVLPGMRIDIAVVVAVVVDAVAGLAGSAARLVDSAAGFTGSAAGSVDHFGGTGV